MAVKLAFNEFPQFIDGDGVPITGAQLFTYIAGSSTKATTYQDDAGSTPNSNPIVCDSAGRVPYPVWLTTGVSYKFVLAPADDTDPPTSPIWTLDDVTGINDASITQDQWVAGPTPTYIGATSFSLVGDQTSTFQVGRRLKTTNSGGTVYSTITASAYTSLTTVTVANDSGTLDAGLSAVSYGLLTSVDMSIPRSVGVTVAAHATTMNPWVAEVVTLSGAAVTFTDLADAAFVGQQVMLIMNAAHVFTDGAVFDVQGGMDYTAAAGDMVLLTATAVDAFDVTIFRALGGGVVEIVASTNLPSANSVTIQDIPQGFSKLILFVTSASSDTNTRAVQATASADNGSTEISLADGNFIQNTTVNALLASTLLAPTSTQTAAQSTAWTLEISGYQSGCFKKVSVAGLYADSTVFSGNFSIRSTSAINALIIKLNDTGNFDAGTYALYGVL